MGAAALAARALTRRNTGFFPGDSWFARLSRYLDIRLLVIGSLLPDLIDKPVGLCLFRQTFENGRIYSHTLLFLILISAAGLILKLRFGQRWMLALAAGVFTHLIFDEMWMQPGTLFWPFSGWGFEQIVLTGGFIGNMFSAMFTEPKIIITEAIGLFILLWFSVTLLLKKKVLAFIRKGKTV